MNRYMNILKRIFGKSNQKPNSNKWVELDVSEIGEYGNVIPRILGKEIAGINISNFLNEEELMTICKDVENYAEHEGIPTEFGKVFGFPLLAVTEESRKQWYYEQSIEFLEKKKKMFGFNIEDRLSNIFRTLSGKETKVIHENENKYISGNFRIMFPNLGGLKAHTGNEFFERGKDTFSMKYLDSIMNVYDSLSYFIYLQVPEEGGELAIYDLNWHQKNGKSRGFFGENASSYDDEFINKFFSYAIKGRKIELLMADL